MGAVALASELCVVARYHWLTTAFAHILPGTGRGSRGSGSGFSGRGG